LKFPAIGAAESGYEVCVETSRACAALQERTLRSKKTKLRRLSADLRGWPSRFPQSQIANLKSKIS